MSDATAADKCGAHFCSVLALGRAGLKWRGDLLNGFRAPGYGEVPHADRQPSVMEVAIRRYIGRRRLTSTEAVLHPRS